MKKIIIKKGTEKVPCGDGEHAWNETRKTWTLDFNGNPLTLVEGGGWTYVDCKPAHIEDVWDAAARLRHRDGDVDLALTDVESDIANEDDLEEIAEYQEIIRLINFFK